MKNSLAIDLIRSLPRCIYNASEGLRHRCPNIGTHVVEFASGERDYGAQVCAEHIDYATTANPGSVIHELLYTKPLIALAKELDVKLVCADPKLSGVRE